MTAATAARPKRRRLLFALIGVVAVIVVGFFASLVVRRQAAVRRLAAAIADLDRTDPGWRLVDIERARARVPQAENSARALGTAFGKLNRNGSPPASIEADLSPNVRLTADQDTAVRAQVATNADAVPAVLALADYPRGRHGIAHAADAVSTPLPHADRMSQVNAWALQPLALLAVQDGDAARAIVLLRAQLNLGRALRDEPYLISQLIRARHRKLAVRGFERLLGHATLSPDQLAAVRHELEAELADDPWPVALRGERASADQFMEGLRSGAAKTSQVKPMLLRGYNPSPVERAGDRLNDFIAPEVDPAHAFLLDILTRTLATARLPWHERLPAVQALDAEWAVAPEPARWWLQFDRSKWLTGLVFDQARLRTAVAAVAVEQHRVAHGDWPASLAALGPLPNDPFSGKPLLLKRTTNGVTIYSVGPNLRDDGGELAKDDGNIPKDGDLGVRLWDMPQRNQPPGDGP